MRFIKTRDVNALAGSLRSVAVLAPAYNPDSTEFQNQYVLHYIGIDGSIREIGELKISCGVAPALSGARSDFRAPSLDDAFDFLPPAYFSLGQSESYYEELMGLEDKIALSILKHLNDCAYDLDLFDRCRDEPGMRHSLLNKVSAKNVRNRFHRLCHRDPTLTPYEFRYTFPRLAVDLDIAPPTIDFVVEPHSLPPTNVHVLIGRNGVGKTVCLQSIARTLLRADTDGASASGTVELLGDHRDTWAFSNMVWVSFSAFNHFDLPASSISNMKAFSIGLRYTKAGSTDNLIKSGSELNADFCRSFHACRRGARNKRWAKAIQTLSSDVMFNESDATALLKFGEGNWQQEASAFFEELSSGHKLVLLTMTRLVETVGENTVVLIDEPETHLHPPLLSAFIRALADLLFSMNGVAIVATHSPVVLQEVPASCVSVIERHGPFTKVKRPRIETFGENIGLLTSEVFRLNVTDAGFHRLLLRATNDSRNTFEQITEKFSDQLGGEARAILMGMVVNRNRGLS